MIRPGASSGRLTITGVTFGVSSKRRIGSATQSRARGPPRVGLDLLGQPAARAVHHLPDDLVLHTHRMTVILPAFVFTSMSATAAV